MSVRLDHGKDELDEVHEINVTPFIDVMLVLLIIFMVAAPLATVDIAVDLPASTAAAAAAARQAGVPDRASPISRLTLGDERSRATRSPARSIRPRTATRTRASSCAPTRSSPMAS